MVTYCKILQFNSGGEKHFSFQEQQWIITMLHIMTTLGGRAWASSLSNARLPGIAEVAGQGFYNLELRNEKSSKLGVVVNMDGR